LHAQVEYLLARFPETTMNREPRKHRTISASRMASFSIFKFHVTEGLLGTFGRKFQAAIQIDLPLRFDGAPLS
jgi:hypothetical protein